MGRNRRSTPRTGEPFTWGRAVASQAGGVEVMPEDTPVNIGVLLTVPFTAGKQVLEPIFETDFHPASYGFRPRRRAQDAIEEIRKYAREGYEWIFEADITACFDEIDHTALLGLVRRRIKDKRVVTLIKAFLKA